MLFYIGEKVQEFKVPLQNIYGKVKRLMLVGLQPLMKKVKNIDSFEKQLIKLLNPKKGITAPIDMKVLRSMYFVLLFFNLRRNVNYQM